MIYEYDDEGKPSKEAYAHNILGVLSVQSGVCESYARTFQLMMNALNIENNIITEKVIKLLKEKNNIK